MRRDKLREWARNQYEESAREASAKRHGKSNVASLDERKRRIHAEHLTKNPIWDEYIGLVEELQEKTLAEIKDAERRLLSQEYLDDGECSALRHQMAVLKATFDARTECIRIPSRVLDPA